MAMLALLGLLAVVPSPLAPLDAYAGHCWVATIAPDTTDRHCFERIYDGAHIRDRHVVRKAGRVVYAGETLYSAEGGKLVFTYWNSLGGVGRGTATSAGATLAFVLTMRATPDASSQAIRTSWRRTAAGYEVTTGADIRRFTPDGRAGSGEP